MIDLETYALDDNAVILSVGISVVDSEWNEVDSYYVNVNIDEQVNTGRNINPDTVEWWSKQSSEAVNTIFDNPDYPQANVNIVADDIVRLTNIWRARTGDKILYWGNSARFDVEKLNTFIYLYSTDVETAEFFPDYFQRCFKTLRDVSEAFYGVKYNREDVKHDALADARQQVEFVKRLQGYGAQIKPVIETIEKLAADGTVEKKINVESLV